MVEAGKYKCPICDTIHSKDDCIIIKQEVESTFIGRERDYANDTLKMRAYKDTYLVKYFNVRICPKCAKKRKMHYIYALIVPIVLLILMFIRNLSSIPDKSTVLEQISIVIVAGGIICAFIYAIIALIITKSHKIDIEKAKENRAIAIYDAFDRLMN
ncbi:MAG: hypothetical protein IKU02_05175 [Bacteroidaceae bacterium]|nr:hypothetical protein [Bacteroidaceae bacterium]